MSVEIIPLGTRGWIPLNNRQTMCILIKYKGANLLLDCGTGISRLIELGIDDVLNEGPLNILFSHYHLDHLVGLSYLSEIVGSSDRKIRLIGPGSSLVSEGLHVASNVITSPPLFGTKIKDSKMNVEFFEFENESFEIDGIKIYTNKQQHKGGSVGLRIENVVSYHTDVSETSETIEFAKKSKCLIHETYTLTKGIKGPYHSAIDGVIDISKKAQVECLIPVHYGPKVTEEEIQCLSSYSDSNLRVIVPNEGLKIKLD